ncbi:hypothetical protein R6Q57_013260 [Mikania cordata]
MQDAPSKMSRTHLLLHNKLHELELELTHLPYQPPETSSSNPIAHRFRHRLLFLRNLLTAEISVHASKPNHLLHIKERLDELESTLSQRCSHMNSSDDVDGDDDLACSCMDSSLYDDGDQSEGMRDEEGLGVYEDPENVNEAVVLPTEPEKAFGYQDMEPDDDRKENDDGGSRCAWPMWDIRVMAIWMMLGAILMVNISKLFYII